MSVHRHRHLSSGSEYYNSSEIGGVLDEFFGDPKMFIMAGIADRILSKITGRDLSIRDLILKAFPKYSIIDVNGDTLLSFGVMHQDIHMDISHGTSPIGYDLDDKRFTIGYKYSDLIDVIMHDNHILCNYNEHFLDDPSVFDVILGYLDGGEDMIEHCKSTIDAIMCE